MTPKPKKPQLTPVEDGQMVVLRCIGHRVPRRGDLYIGKDCLIHRCLEDRIYSNRAKVAPIVKESWL